MKRVLVISAAAVVAVAIGWMAGVDRPPAPSKGEVGVVEARRGVPHPANDFASRDGERTVGRANNTEETPPDAATPDPTSNAARSAATGTVAEVYLRPGMVLSRGDPMVRLWPDGGPARAERIRALEVEHDEGLEGVAIAEDDLVRLQEELDALVLELRLLREDDEPTAGGAGGDVPRSEQLRDGLTERERWIAIKRDQILRQRGQLAALEEELSRLSSLQERGELVAQKEVVVGRVLVKPGDTITTGTPLFVPVER